MRSEDDISRTLKRRLGSTRASVMLEFAFVAPLVAAAIAFAADFTRILRAGQQLEIATRLVADVEAHMCEFGKGNGSPCDAARRIGEEYLVTVAHVTDTTTKVFMKGGNDSTPNPITKAIAAIRSFLNGGVSESGWFWDLVGKILGSLLNFVTFRTVDYLTEVVPHDREVWVTTAVYVPTVLPEAAYSWLFMPAQQDGHTGVGQFAEDLRSSSAATTAWGLELQTDYRHRVFCYMPVIDAVPIAPKTYVRVFKSWCSRQPFLKGLAN